MPLDQAKLTDWDSRIKKLARAGAKDLVEDLPTILKEMEDSGAATDELDKLLKTIFLFGQMAFRDPASTPLLPQFFSQLATIRKKYGNLLDQPVVASLVKLVQTSDVTLLTTRQAVRLLTAVDGVGLECPGLIVDPVFRALIGAPRKDAAWARNTVHFLLHCKNTALLESNRDAVAALIPMLCTTLCEHGAEALGFTTADFQCCSDVFLYAEHALKMPAIVTPEVWEVVTPALRESEVHPSRVQQQIFTRIVKCLENRGAGEEEWQHVAKRAEAEYGASFSLGGITVEIEGGYAERCGVVVKRGDIVIRKGDKIIVVEVDGRHSHMLGAGVANCRTKARDRLVKAIVGEEECFVIDQERFDRFLNLDTRQLGDTALFARIRALMQEPEVALAPTVTRVASSVSLPASQEVAPLVEVKAAGPVVRAPRKTAQDLQVQLVELLQIKPMTDDAVESVEAILCSRLFAGVRKEEVRIGDGASSPINYCLIRYSKTKSEEEKTLLKDTITLLWCYGFKLEGELPKSVKKLPPELQQIVGKAAPKPEEQTPVSRAPAAAAVAAAPAQEAVNLLDIFKHLALNTWNPHQLIAMIDNQILPEVLLKDVMHFALKNLDNGGRAVIRKMHEAAFASLTAVKAECFVECLQSQNRGLVVLLENEGDDFCQPIFLDRPELMKEIFTIEDERVREAIIAKIMPNEALAIKLAICAIEEKQQELLDMEIFRCFVTTERKAEGDLLYLQGICHKTGTIFEKNSVRALECLTAFTAMNPEHANALRYLGWAYNDVGNKAKSVDCITRAAQLGDGQANYEMFLFTFDQTNTATCLAAKPFLEAAVEAEHPDALCKKAMLTGGDPAGKEFGYGFDRDLSLRLFARALKLGSAKALLNEAKLELDPGKYGFQHDPNHVKAHSYIVRAVKKGSEAAQVDLINFYINGCDDGCGLAPEEKADVAISLCERFMTSTKQPTVIMQCFVKASRQLVALNPTRNEEMRTKYIALRQQVELRQAQLQAAHLDLTPGLAVGSAAAAAAVSSHTASVTKVGGMRPS